MNTLPEARLADLSPPMLAAIKRRAHLQRSEAVYRAASAGFAWLGAVIREAGAAALLSEVPRPYRAPSPRRCG